MNKIKFFTLCILISSFFLSGCEAFDKLTQFDMDFEAQATIQSNSPINLPFNITTPEITTNSTSTFESNNTRKHLIESIFLKELKIELTAPQNGNFDFINEIRISLKAEGLADTEIAYIDEVPPNSGQTLLFDVVSTDIQEFIKKDDFQISIDVTTDEVLTQDYQVLIKSIFAVDAKIFGV